MWNVGTPVRVFRPSLNHFIGMCQDRRRRRQPEGFGSLEVDDELELLRLLDGEISGPGSFEDLVHVHGGVPVHLRETGRIGDKTAVRYIVSVDEDRRQSV